MLNSYCFIKITNKTVLYSYFIYYLHFLFIKIYIRTIFAVYEMVGSKADQTKAEELFNRLDLNSDGSISQEEFITIIKQDQDLLNVLQNTP